MFPPLTSNEIGLLEVMPTFADVELGTAKLARSPKTVLPKLVIVATNKSGAGAPGAPKALATRNYKLPKFLLLGPVSSSTNKPPKFWNRLTSWSQSSPTNKPS